MNTPTANILAKLKAKTASNKLAEPELPIEVAAVVEAIIETDAKPPELPVVVVEAAELVAEYQQYTASKVSTCLITPNGKRINFTNYQYYTKDPEIIRYLDKEIARGLKGFIKGKILTAEELNPEAAKKREIIEEFKISQEGREFGNTKPESERTSVLSSDQVAN